MRSTDERPFPRADRFPAAEGGPLFELEAIRRTLDDLTLAERTVPKPGERAALMWSAAALLALVAFMVWLLIAR